jgi:hypothetical protein
MEVKRGYWKSDQGPCCGHVLPTAAVYGSTSDVCAMISLQFFFIDISCVNIDVSLGMKRWLDDVQKDVREMEIEGLRRKAQDRDQWRRIAQEAKAHVGL